MIYLKDIFSIAGLIIFILVQVVLIIFIVKSQNKHNKNDGETPFRTQHRITEIFWISLPVLTLGIIFYYTLKSIITNFN
ncbi:MAG: hypothetical protein LDLANPLL_01940 [Turneriella sp.]|nr:hypothetical protein [Turneriella sp.]